VIQAAQELGIRTPLQPYITTALGASEVKLIELANAYRALASGILTDAHAIDHVIDADGNRLPQAPRVTREIHYPALEKIQEGLRGVVRLPDGTAYSLAGPDFGIPVMGKTGTTSDFRDALFVGSTYGMDGITVAVRIGFDDYHSLGASETGGRAALPIFREVMKGVYKHQILGPPPQFPKEIEDGIDGYLAQVAADAALGDPEAPVAAPTLAPLGVGIAPSVAAPSVVSPSGAPETSPSSDQPLSFPAAPRAVPVNRDQSASRPGGVS
jgi:membrane peptidoglycan carboxypeptidase